MVLVKFFGNLCLNLLAVVTSVWHLASGDLTHGLLLMAAATVFLWEAEAALEDAGKGGKA